MATQGALPTVATPASSDLNILASDPQAAQDYKDATQQVLDALQQRANYNNWYQVAGALLDPGRTGSFGEALGKAATVYGNQQEQNLNYQLPIAQMKAQLQLQNAAINNQMQGIGVLANLAGSDADSVSQSLSQGVIPTKALIKMTPMQASYLDSRFPNMGGIFGKTLNQMMELIKTGASADQAAAAVSNSIGKLYETQFKTGKMPVTPLSPQGNIVSTAPSGGAAAPQASAPQTPAAGPSPQDYSSQVAGNAKTFMNTPGLYEMVAPGAKLFNQMLDQANVTDPQQRAFLQSLHLQESSGMLNAPDSSKGAKGPMQLMPDTFKQVMPQGDITSPDDNMMAGIKYGLQGYNASNGDLNAAAQHYYTGSMNSQTAPIATPTAAPQAAPVTAPTAAPAGDTGQSLTPEAQVDLQKDTAKQLLKPSIAKISAIASIDPYQIAQSRALNMELNQLATKDPTIFGLLRQGKEGGWLNAAASAVAGGITAGGTSIKIPGVETYVQNRNLTSQQMADLTRATQIFSQLFMLNATNLKSIFGSRISNLDAQLSKAQFATPQDTAAAVKYWTQHEAFHLGMAQRLSDLYYNYTQNNNVAQNPEGFLHSPDYTTFINSYVPNYMHLVNTYSPANMR